MKPNLETPEGRRAYGAELARVARGWRWAGLAIVVLGAVGLVLSAKYDQPWGSPLGLATIAALVVGWGLAIVGIVKRTRYHGQRMRGWPGAGG
jgi:hypothetical protein